MRIVHFTDSLVAGGKERQLIELLKELAKEPAVHCEVITMSKKIHYPSFDALNITIHYLLRHSKKDLTIFFRLYSLLQQIQPDILHTWNSMCATYAAPVTKLLHIPFVNGLRSAPPRLHFYEKRWLRSRFTFPFSSAIVANSRAGLVAYNAPRHKSFCIHNGFDFTRISHLANEQVIRDNYAITTTYVVGMVASFSDKKDYDTYLSTAQKILDQRDDVTFIAVGDGKNLELQKQQIATKFMPKILFLGRQKQVESIANMFTIGVLTSNATIHGEGISNAIMEYMALGKPVVATDCGGTRELVIDGTTGYLVQNKNVSELADRLMFLLDHHELVEAFGKAGKQRLKDTFDSERMVNDYLLLYRNLDSR